MGSKLRMMLFVLGSAFFVYGGGGDVVGGNALKPVLDRVRKEVLKTGCLADGAVAIDGRKGVEPILNKIAASMNVDDVTLEIPRNRIYVEERIADVMKKLPFYCANLARLRQG